MKIDKLDTHIKDIRFKTPLKFGGSFFEKKQSLFVNAEFSNGKQAQAELSFLPFLHKYSLVEIEKELNSICSNLIFDLQEIKLSTFFFNTLQDMPNISKPALYIIESLLLNVLNLFSDRENIKNNDLFIPYAENNLDDLIKKWKAQKTECLKVKIGHLDFKQDLSIIRKLQKNFLLRLDANRSLSIEKLISFIDHIGTHNIDYWEEPLENFSDYLKIPKVVPIAYDENIQQYLQQKELKAKALVLKPSYFGSLSECFDLISTRTEKITISSSFETKIGLNVLQQLALFNNHKHFSYSGLDTLKYLI